MMVFDSQTKTISLILQGQRGTQIFLMPNSGWTFAAPLSAAPAPPIGRPAAAPQLWHRANPAQQRGGARQWKSRQKTLRQKSARS
jgi:hypothetical protein